MTAVQFASFISAHQTYDKRGRWVEGPRMCRECRAACGCQGCRRTA